MTFYEEQVLKIRELYLPHEYQILRVVRAKQFMDCSLNDITLQEIAGEAALSKFHFIRLFKKCYGKTPHQYLTDVRMIKARQLLRSGLSTTETCYALNYSSVTSFIGLFKKYTGITPSGYQQKKQFSRALV